MMKKILHIIFLSALLLTAISSRAFDRVALRPGDLLFKEYPSDSAFTDAVVAATNSIDAYKFSHVGIVTDVAADGVVTVTEAVFTGVRETPLDSFLLSARHIGSQPIVVAARVKTPYAGAVDAALPELKKLLGKPYDREFLPDNDAYYCSELVYATFLVDGNPVFEARPMTFKDRSTGQTSPLWIKYFEELKRPIPEGVIGTNPGDLSRSPRLTILGLVAADI